MEGRGTPAGSAPGVCPEGAEPGSAARGLPGKQLRPGTAVGARNQNEESFFRNLDLPCNETYPPCEMQSRCFKPLSIGVQVPDRSFEIHIWQD